MTRKALCLKTTGLICFAGRNLAAGVRAFGFPGERIQKIAGGVDVERFRPALDTKVVREGLELPADRRLLLSVRRLAPRMGLDNLIQAMPAIVARCPDMLLLLGGKGPERERLEMLTRALGMESHIRLVGFIPDAQLAAYYQAADLFVLPTVALEGFGLVTVEALSCGVPVIGTPVGATPEILNDLDSRLVADGVSPGCLAAGILAFFEQEWSQELTPERLHRFVQQNYPWGKHVLAVEAVYEAMAGRSEGQSYKQPLTEIAQAGRRREFAHRESAWFVKSRRGWGGC